MAKKAEHRCVADWNQGLNLCYESRGEFVACDYLIVAAYSHCESPQDVVVPTVLGTVNFCPFCGDESPASVLRRQSIHGPERINVDGLRDKRAQRDIEFMGTAVLQPNGMYRCVAKSPYFGIAVVEVSIELEPQLWEGDDS